jgi:hypothetical protein
MLRSQMQSNIQAREADERRIQSHKDQEKHWKCGYESIYQKYSKLKDELQQRDADMGRLEADHGD